MYRGQSGPFLYRWGCTDEAFRRQGLMGQLLHLAAASSEHPITLFPAVRSFYEAHGYTTTSRLLSFPLRGGKESHTPLLPVEGEALDRIYRTANAESGYLVRDEAAWEFLTGGYETVLVEDAYAFISEGKATEAFALNTEGQSASSMPSRRWLSDRCRVLRTLRCPRSWVNKTGCPPPWG